MRNTAAAVMVAVMVAGVRPPSVDASDHIDAPLVAPDSAADLGDLYAWHTDDDRLVIGLTFAGLLAAGDDPLYDDGVLYTIHIDTTADPAEVLDWYGNDNDNESDIEIHFRLGQDAAGDWFVQVTNLPGADGVLVGPTGAQIGDDDARAMIGLFDDPFFFDYDGFLTTAANLVDDTDPVDLAFAGAVGEPVDSFSGLNTMALVLEVPLDEVPSTHDFLQIWGTSGRLP